jgi:hypothetical protein
MKTKVFFIIACAIFFIDVNAQNTFPSTGAAGIGTTSPNSSSLLEVKSTTKGVLIPRMTLTQRNAIASPATSLLIYQTNSTPGFYYYNGSAWTAVSSKGANTTLSNLVAPTSINMDLLPSSTNTINLGSGTQLWKNVYFDTIHFGDGSTQSNALWKKKGSVAYYNSGNVGIGTSTPSAKLEITGDAVVNGITVGRGLNGTAGDVAIGNLALSSNNGGYQNTAVGDAALQSNTTGGYNVGVGLGALQANTGGFSNTAVGQRAMYANTTGGDNTACGQNALYSNLEGTSNIAIGYQSLFSSTYGVDNNAIGYQSMYSNVNGHYNVADGYKAFYDNTTGIENVAIGYYALAGSKSGVYLTAVGPNAGVSDTAFSFSSAFGYDATITASNQVRIGDSYTTSIGGFTDWSNISDGRVKKNIKQNVPGLAFINKLQPITYNLDLDAADNIIQRHPGSSSDGEFVQPAAQENVARLAKEKIVYTGFVAQDVEKAAKDLNYDFSGVDPAKNDKDLYGLRYSDFVVPLVKAVQELDSIQNLKFKNQNEEIAALKQQNENLQKQIEELKALIISNQLTANSQLTTVTSASLQQNIPNPFNQTTTINYTLPQTYSSAKIIVTDKGGRVLKEINVSAEGKGSLQLEASTLSAGAYQYSLYVDGKLIDTKQMALAR